MTSISLILCSDPIVQSSADSSDSHARQARVRLTHAQTRGDLGLFTDRVKSVHSSSAQTYRNRTLLSGFFLPPAEHGGCLCVGGGATRLTSHLHGFQAAKPALSDSVSLFHVFSLRDQSRVYCPQFSTDCGDLRLSFPFSVLCEQTFDTRMG